MKLKTLTYWTATAIITLELVAGGATDLARGRAVLVAGQPVVDVLKHLGYPTYLLVILGIWKLLAAATLLAPAPAAPEGVGVCRDVLRADRRRAVESCGGRQCRHRRRAVVPGSHRGRVVGPPSAEPHPGNALPAWSELATIMLRVTQQRHSTTA